MKKKSFFARSRPARRALALLCALLLTAPAALASGEVATRYIGAASDYVFLQSLDGLDATSLTLNGVAYQPTVTEDGNQIKMWSGDLACARLITGGVELSDDAAPDLGAIRDWAANPSNGALVIRKGQFETRRDPAQGDPAKGETQGETQNTTGDADEDDEAIGDGAIEEVSMPSLSEKNAPFVAQWLLYELTEGAASKFTLGNEDAKEDWMSWLTILARIGAGERGSGRTVTWLLGSVSACRAILIGKTDEGWDDASYPVKPWDYLRLDTLGEGLLPAEYGAWALNQYLAGNMPKLEPGLRFLLGDGTGKRQRIALGNVWARPKPQPEGQPIGNPEGNTYVPPQSESGGDATGGDVIGGDVIGGAP